jgi:tetratricopeptide (TPR) repeat protein
LSINPNFWQAENNLGLIHYEQENLTQAIAHWQKAREIAKQAGESQLALAIALYQQGNRGQALNLGKAVKRENPQYTNLEMLAQNHWGENLLADASEFLNLLASGLSS